MLLEGIVPVFVIKSAYEYVSNSKWLPRYSCLNNQKKKNRILSSNIKINTYC